jgi:hypothetical protein
MITAIAKLLAVLAETLAGRRSDEEAARAMLDAAFDSGVPHSLLAEHLTARARDRAELAADIAEAAKLLKLHEGGE